MAGERLLPRSGAVTPGARTIVAPEVFVNVKSLQDRNFAGQRCGRTAERHSPFPAIRCLRAFIFPELTT